MGLWMAIYELYATVNAAETPLSFTAIEYQDGVVPRRSTIRQRRGCRIYRATTFTTLT